MKTLKLIFTLLAYMLSLSLLAQSEMAEYAAKADKIKVRLDMPLEGRMYKNGTGYALNAKLLPELPKKVALISFYTVDPGYRHVWKLAGVEHTKTIYMGTDTSDPIAEEIYSRGIDLLISKFAEMGMELLEPKEFLDTQEKEDFYNGYYVAYGGDNIAFSSSSMKGQIFSTPDSYKVISLFGEPQVAKKGMVDISGTGTGGNLAMAKIGKEITSINTLTTALEVDAVLVFHATVFSNDTREINLQNVAMQMFGPNPTSLPEGQDSKFNFFPGQMYIGTRVNANVNIIKPSKKDMMPPLDMTGFEAIMEAMTIRFDDYFTKAFAKRDK
jgi:hypothetical protein